MLALALALSLSASPRVTYELKCLYCHSDMTEDTRLTEPGWMKLVERMRKKAPVLITRHDVRVLARYLARERGLVPPKVATKPPGEAKLPEPPPTPPPEPVAEPLKTPAEPEPAAEPEVDSQLEQQGFALMQQRCSKCHSLARVYSKLDGLERALSVIERMELKTGSGITEKDAALLERYVRAQLGE